MKQYHFTQGSCSTPGSTTWRSRPFYCEKNRSNPRSLWYIWWLLNENHTFWGVFKVSFLPCFQNLFKISIFVSEFWFIAFILIIFFQIFGGSKHAILGKNRRTGSRSGSRSRAWTKTCFWCILKRDKDSKNPGFQDLRFRSKTRHFQVRNCVERCSLSYFYADFKFEIVSIDAMCRMCMRL